MKNKPIIFLGVLAAFGVTCVIPIVPNLRHHAEWNQTVRALRGLPRDRVYSALEAFVRDQKAKGRPSSASVSLRDLVAGGFLRADEAAPFRGAEVTFGIGVDEMRPQQVLVRVPLTDGRVVVELADGSMAQAAK